MAWTGQPSKNAHSDRDPRQIDRTPASFYIKCIMNWEDMARELAYTTDSKIVLLVCDGLGGLPVGGRTELEAARKPNLDEAARPAPAE